MLSYCLKCKEIRDSTNPKVVETKKKNRRIMVASEQFAIVKDQDLSKSKKLVKY